MLYTIKCLVDAGPFASHDRTFLMFHSQVRYPIILSHYPGMHLPFSQVVYEYRKMSGKHLESLIQRLDGPPMDKNVSIRSSIKNKILSDFPLSPEEIQYIETNLTIHGPFYSEMLSSHQLFNIDSFSTLDSALSLMQNSYPIQYPAELRDDIRSVLSPFINTFSKHSVSKPTIFL